MKCSGCDLTDKDFESKGLFLAHCRTHGKPEPDNKVYIPWSALPKELDQFGPSDRLRFFYLTGYYRGQEKGLEIESIKRRPI